MHFNRVAKLLGFFSITNDNENKEQNRTNGEQEEAAIQLQPGRYAVGVISIDTPTDISTLLSTTYMSTINDKTTKKKLSIFPLDFIKGPAYCIENIVDPDNVPSIQEQTQVFVLKTYHEWKNLF